MLLFDSIFLPVALLWAIGLRYGWEYIPEIRNVWVLFIPVPVVGCIVFMRFGLYRAVIRYLNLHALSTITLAVSTLVASWFLLLLFLNFLKPEYFDIPRSRSVPFIFWLLCLLFVGGSRFLARWIFTFSLGNSIEKKAVIYGAGVSGMRLAMILEHGGGYRIIAFVDDDSSLWKRTIHGKHVYSPANIKRLLDEKNVDEILLAMPNIAKKRRIAIRDELKQYSTIVRDIPSIEKIASGELKVSDVRDIDIYDLLIRHPIQPDDDLLHKNISGKSVMITGAGGTIGSELARQVLRNNPKQLILYELNEFSLYKIDRELEKYNPQSIIIIPVLGNILDNDKLSTVIKQHQIETIYHAAAYKHVPMVEANPKAGLVNNVIGTLNLVKEAQRNQAKTFVLISTDKAVRPTNIMGASKRLAEMILQAWAEKSDHTVFTMVRFGNVLNSSGSVIPVFKEQIDHGGPVTVTHPDITRFFMLIPEAVELVIQAGAMAGGGEVFVLDMGKPVKIDNLARRMIYLSGKKVKDIYNPDGDIAIKYTGLRDGEKLYEELLISDSDDPTSHPSIKRAHEEKIGITQLEQYIDEISDMDDNFLAVSEFLAKVVSGYTPYSRKEKRL